MLAALVVILLLVVLFGGLGIYVSNLFLFGILAVVLIALVFGGTRYRGRHHG